MNRPIACFLWCVLFISVIQPNLSGAPPATAPSTAPSPVAAAQAELDKATAAAEAAKVACQKRLDADPAYHKLSVDLQAKWEALDDARSSDNTQAKLDAGSAYNIARLNLESVAKKAIDSDPDVLHSIATEKAARQFLVSDERSESQRMSVEVAAKEEADKEARIKKEADDFDATRTRKQIDELNHILDRQQQTEEYVIIAGDNRSEIEADIAKTSEELHDLSKTYLAWSDALPPMQDIPNLLKGETLEQAQKTLKTKIPILISSDAMITYAVDSDSYSISFSIRSGEKAIAFVDVLSLAK